MTPQNGNIIVKFEYDKTLSVVKQDNGLFIPERYVIEEADEDADTAWGVTTDRKLINPQTVYIFSGDYTGKTAFVHYGAFEVCKWLDDDYALIPEKMILFLVDPIQCMPGTYLGDEVFGELPKTTSGIYLTPELEEKVGVKVKITHLPENHHELITIGAIVITIDAYQYELNYEGKKYIKLSESEIVGIDTQDGCLPIGNNLLVEYLPDADLSERIAENDRRRAQRDFIDKNRYHISEQYAKGIDPNYLDLPEPKFCYANILAIGELVKDIQVGDKLLIHRNFGCILPNKQCIINIEAVLGVVK